MSETARSESHHARDPLAVERTELARGRNRLAQDRTDLARERVHLANKRTFLAWCRTSLALMGFGFLLEKVGLFLHDKNLSPELLGDFTVFGVAAFILGPLLLLFAGWRYLALQRHIGMSRKDLFVIPEIVLFVLVLAFAVFYLTL